MHYAWILELCMAFWIVSLTVVIVGIACAAIFLGCLELMDKWKRFKRR